MKKKLLSGIILLIAVSSYSQTLFVPSGAAGIGSSGNGNVGIGTSSPLEALHVAGNIQLGNSLQYTAGSYQINMPGGSATINNGNGRDLVVIAGSSDNQSSVRGGFLILRPGMPTAPSNNYGNVIIADTGGNLGVGTLTPIWKLDVNGQLASRGQAVIDVNSTEINIGDIASGDGLRDKLNFHTRDVKRMTINEVGNVGIGTTNPTQKLTVSGTIYGKEVKVDLNVPGPDYVFADNYQLQPLNELKTYIDQNKHLPEVPSAAVMEADGINLGEMNMILLKKVEELTLYQIEAMKRIEKLEAELKSKK